jgi:hypothetical protein
MATRFSNCRACLVVPGTLLRTNHPDLYDSAICQCQIEHQLTWFNLGTEPDAAVLPSGSMQGKLSFEGRRQEQQSK